MTDPPAFKPDTPAEIVVDALLELSPVPSLETAVEWFAQDRLPQRAFLLFMRNAYPKECQRWVAAVMKERFNRVMLDTVLHGRAEIVSLPNTDKPTVLKALDFLTIQRECRIPESWLLNPLQAWADNAIREKMLGSGFIYGREFHQRKEPWDRCVYCWQDLKPIDLLPPEYGPSPLAGAYRAWRQGQALFDAVAGL